MKERPILFNGEMVRAILDGRKTQARRVVNPQPDRFYTDGSYGALDVNGDYVWIRDALPMVGATNRFGVPGDRLWVRETFCKSPDGFVYRSTEQESGSNQPDDHCCWKPSIHMPRTASRITLEIESVRVERVQEMTRGDAIAEGCPFANVQSGLDPRAWFSELWDSINAERGLWWESNPWVWAITFRRVK